ncbi:phage virion morphogenesis protein [Marinobacterium sedimentorum]|uniref:phage virion morphogenesis protein n=1 Tax=Marinobacterium sedimentorum TaxID=2927804 RepID=UPI0020C67D03|nr:phage virion morphogenesis protein [Marinobacterium sedimentorum]MCP8687757.1 phage virion morphogenesis protein [Marinobacterium sedimentorum]
MNDLTRLETWVTPLLQKIGPAERRQLARTLATELRRSQRQRIAEQHNPDGTAFAPRSGEEKAGRIKRKAMFLKMRQARFLKARSNANSVSVGFFGRIARIARVHQYGMRDRVFPGGPEAQYQQRELLGYSARDLDMIQEILINSIF